MYRVTLNNKTLVNNPLGLDTFTTEFIRDNEIFGIYSISSFDLVFVGDGFCITSSKTVGRVWCGWAVREWRVKECVVFLVGGWDGWGGGRQRQRAVVYREKDLTDRCFGEGSRGMW